MAFIAFASCICPFTYTYLLSILRKAIWAREAAGEAQKAGETRTQVEEARRLGEKAEKIAREKGNDNIVLSSEGSRVINLFKKAKINIIFRSVTTSTSPPTLHHCQLCPFGPQQSSCFDRNQS